MFDLILAVVAVLATVKAAPHTVYCPASHGEHSSNPIVQGDDKYPPIPSAGYTHQYGLNIYANQAVTDNPFKPDCYLRFTATHKPTNDTMKNFLAVNGMTHETVDTAGKGHGGNGKGKLLVMIHGWQPEFNLRPTHVTPDTWDGVVTDSVGKATCDGAADGGSDCLPTSHDAQAWYEKGWNVVFFDWKEYAFNPKSISTTELVGVKTPESRLYEPVKGGENGKNVVELFSDLLHEYLTMIGFPESPLVTRVGTEDRPCGDDCELRIAGNSLGGQFSMLLANEIVKKGKYKKMLTRIALLDPYWSGEKQKGKADVTPEWAQFSNSAWAREIEKKLIADSHVNAVIEFYKTSVVTNSAYVPLIASFSKGNTPLKQTAMYVRQHFKFLGAISVLGQPSASAKHVSAMGSYLHQMKWSAEQRPAQEKAGEAIPTCQVSTAKLFRCYSDNACPKNYNQDAGTMTTYDHDDHFANTGDTVAVVIPAHEYRGPSWSYGHVLIMVIGTAMLLFALCVICCSAGTVIGWLSIRTAQSIPLCAEELKEFV